MSVGQDHSNVRGADTSLNNTVSVTVGSPWAEVNITHSATWETDHVSTNTTSSSTDNGSIVSYSGTTTLATDPWDAKGESPNAAPWTNDKIDLLLNPQFAIWDLTNCSFGVAFTKTDGSNGSACPSGATVGGHVGMEPLAVASDEVFAAGQLVPCAQGTGTITLADGAPLSEADCQSILAQDPFAGPALGLVPTPAGQLPGQAVNPAAVLGTPNASQFDLPHSEPPDNKPELPVNPPFERTWNEDTASTNSSTTSSTVSTDLTSIEANSVSIKGSTGNSIGVFDVGASDKFTYAQTDTSGVDMTETYSGSQTFTHDQGFGVDYAVDDQNYTTSQTPYFDSRFSTVMFQEGVRQLPGAPVVTSAASTTFTTAAGLAEHGKKIAAGGRTPCRRSRRRSPQHLCSYYPRASSSPPRVPPRPAPRITR